MSDSYNSASQDEVDALLESMHGVETPGVAAPDKVSTGGSGQLHMEGSSAGGTGAAKQSFRPTRIEEIARANESMHGFDRVQDIPLDLSVELGRTTLLIRDILELGTGSIIELDRVAGEPVDLLANGRLIARGEVVVVDECFAVRVTEVVSTSRLAPQADYQDRVAA